MNTHEKALLLPCEHDELIAILHQPIQPSNTGLLIIVGGPQYRVGSHRQFVLLARYLAAHGFPVMRFDYRGMGDASGTPRLFSKVDTDIRTALNHFYHHTPQLKKVVLWGLCDAASAAVLYAYQDARVQGLILLNPWVFSAQGAAKTYLKHYYLQRVFSYDLWKKLLQFKFSFRESSRFFLTQLQQLFNKSKTAQENSSTLNLPQTLQHCLQQFTYPVYFILSEQDLTANEFRELVKSDKKWQTLLAAPTVQLDNISASNHTFSSEKWRQQVAEKCLKWLRQLEHQPLSP